MARARSERIISIVFVKLRTVEAQSSVTKKPVRFKGDTVATSYPEMESTRAFWNVNPCGMHGSYEDQKAQRYAMEPWLPGVLKYIASTQPNSILEIGCG